MLVLPTEPVTPKIVARLRSRDARPSAWSAAKVSSTSTCGPFDRLRDDRARGARGEGGVDELVAVVDGAGHGDEQIAGADLAAVEGDAGDFERRARDVPPVAAAISSAVHSALMPAHSRATSASSNGSTRSPMIWPGLVALAGDQDDVAGAGDADRFGDRFAPAADLGRARRAGHDRGADRRRILAARIVVGDDHQVGHARRDRAHLRPLALVAVAAGAEHGDQPGPASLATCGRSAAIAASSASGVWA